MTEENDPKSPSVDTGLPGDHHSLFLESATRRDPTVARDITRQAAVATPWTRILIWPMLQIIALIRSGEVASCGRAISETPNTPVLFAAALSRGSGAEVLRPACCLWEQMGCQAIIKGGNAGTRCVLAALHPENLHHTSHWSLHLQWLSPQRLHTLPDIWQRGRNEGWLRRADRVVEPLAEADHRFRRQWWGER